MNGERHPNRIEIRRANRRYVLCGLRPLPLAATHPSPRLRFARRAGLLPGATLLLIVLFSAFVLGRPPLASEGSRAPAVARFTFSDFAAASR